MKLYIFESAQIYFPDRSVMTPGKGHDPITIPDIFFLIVHPQGLALFDTGLNLDIWSPEAKKDITQNPGQKVDTQLARLGYAPRDIKYVIMSHLHSDHAGGMDLFPDATFIVRKAELRAAWWPERFQWAYRFEDFKNTRDFNFIELDDHEEFDVFLDGSVVCLDTKGHTQGHQSLIVKLPNSGTFVLPADAADMEEILDEGLIPGVVWNGEAAMRAVRKVQHLRKEGAFVVMGHDPEQFRTLKLVPGYYD
jgi:N-acyl homoserine lactone hydrolase